MKLIDKVKEVSEQYKNQFAGTPESVPEWFIANKLNEKTSVTEDKYKPISCNTIKAILLLNGEFASLKIQSENPTISPLKLLCANVLETLSSFENIDVSVSDYYIGYNEMVNALFDNLVISNKTKTKLLSLLVTEKVTTFGNSWAEENKEEVNSRTIGIARGANPGTI